MGVSIDEFLLEPDMLRVRSFQKQTRRICIILQHFWWILAVPGEIEPTQEIHLPIVPRLAYGGPQHLIYMEQLQHIIVIDDLLNDLKAHVVELKSRFKQLLLCLSTNIGHAGLGPVLILLAIRPVQGWFVVVPHFLFKERLGVVCSRRDNLALKMVSNDSILGIEFLSNIVWTVN